MNGTGSSEDRSTAVQEAIYAALGALESALSADLCAFLTQEEEQGPQLFLGVPDLGLIDPNKAFALFSSLREGLQEGEEISERMVAGYEALLVKVGSARGKALLAVGRRREELTAAERGSAIRFAGALVKLLGVTAPTDEPPAQPSIVRLGIDSSGDRCVAEVSVDMGEQVVQGTAADQMPLRAVAAATMEATGAITDGLKLAHIAEGDVGSARAVLALVLDEQGRSWLGSALVEETADPLHAAARAALAAVLGAGQSQIRP